MTHQRQLIRWVIAMLNAELDDAQLFPEQRAEILRYLDAARDLDEMILRVRQAEINEGDLLMYEGRLADLRKQVADKAEALRQRRVRAVKRRKVERARYWKGRAAA